MELIHHPYRLRAGYGGGSLAEALQPTAPPAALHTRPAVDSELRFPFVATAGTLAALAGLPRREVPGLRVLEAGYFDVTSETAGTRLFLVDPATGAATRVGTGTITISGDVSIDFNPTVDRLRVVSDDGTNLRVNPDTGAATVDGALSYATGAQPGIGAAQGRGGSRGGLADAPLAGEQEDARH